MDIGWIPSTGPQSLPFQVHECNERVATLVEYYAAGRISGQVLRIVMSYAEYVNRTAWSNRVDVRQVNLNDL